MSNFDLAVFKVADVDVPATSLPTEPSATTSEEKPDMYL